MLHLVDNPGFDDNCVVIFDADSDGDPDFLIASLDGPDRLLINTGQGKLALDTTALGFSAVPDPSSTAGTLGAAVADLNGDGRLDLVQSQGELAWDERVYLANESMPVDNAAPILGLFVAEELDGGWLVRARAHDNKSGMMPHDLRSVELRGSEGQTLAQMKWYGEYLWRAELMGAEPSTTVTLCATDAAGNEACLPAQELGNSTGKMSNGKGDTINPPSGETDDVESCAVTTPGEREPAGIVLFFLALLGVLSRRR